MIPGSSQVSVLNTDLTGRGEANVRETRNARVSICSICFHADLTIVLMWSNAEGQGNGGGFELKINFVRNDDRIDILIVGETRRNNGQHKTQENKEEAKRNR